MLPERFEERMRQLMSVAIEEIALGANTEFARQSTDAAKRGMVHPGYSITLRHQNSIWQIEKRVTAALNSLQRVVSVLTIPYSETLAEDLKTQMESYVPDIWCGRLIDSYPRMDDQTKAGYHKELYSTRQAALRKAFLEIDLLVDTLRSQGQNAAQGQQKEREQKFGILLSASQARLDFEHWKAKLTPLSLPIAILFIDLDDFKRLNSRFTETKVDQTILPEAMRLLARIATERGEAYRQGGEEFVVILPNHDRQEARTFGEKLRVCFAQTSFDVDETTLQLTVSVGIAVWPEHGSSYDEVLEKANDAEAQAKRSKNTCVLADVINPSL